MQSRVSPPTTAKGRRAWLFFSLLLPALASKVSTRNSPTARNASHHKGVPTLPYLMVIGPPELRFETPIPPPELSAPATAAPPPKPRPGQDRKSDVIVPVPIIPAPVPVAAPAPAPAAPSAPSVSVATTDAAPAARPPSPPPILGDDVRPQVRPEDFLPYFQYPGAGTRGRDSSMPGQPPPLPRSTATYQESQ